jgi:hypothetical protein
MAGERGFEHQALLQRLKSSDVESDGRALATPQFYRVKPNAASSIYRGPL